MSSLRYTVVYKYPHEPNPRDVAFSCLDDAKDQVRWLLRFRGAEYATLINKESTMAFHYYTPDPAWDGVFPHECEEEGCDNTVPFDDEPKCYKHSPDEGSSVKGYSARMKAEAKEQTTRSE